MELYFCYFLPRLPCPGSPRCPVFTLLVEGLVFKMNTKQGARDGTRAGFFVLFLNIEIHLFFCDKCPSDHCKPAFNYPALKKLILTFLAMSLVLQETWPLQRYRLQHSNGHCSFCAITVARSFACESLWVTWRGQSSCAICLPFGPQGWFAWLCKWSFLTMPYISFVKICSWLTKNVDLFRLQGTILYLRISELELYLPRHKIIQFFFGEVVSFRQF